MRCFVLLQEQTREYRSLIGDELTSIDGPFAINMLPDMGRPALREYQELSQGWERAVADEDAHLNGEKIEIEAGPSKSRWKAATLL